MFIEILYKMLLFKGGVLIYAEHCMCLCLEIGLEPVPLVQLYSGTIILPNQPREFMRRKKRGLLNIVQDSPVP